MKTYLITPYVSAGPIRFGMSRADVRDAMGYTPREFHKTRQSTQKTDAFDKDGINVFYGDNGSVNAVEFNGPAKPELNGITFLGMSEKAVKSWLDENDRNAQDDLPETGWTSTKFGLSWGVDNRRIFTVLAFEKGYF